MGIASPYRSSGLEQGLLPSRQAREPSRRSRALRRRANAAVVGTLSFHALLLFLSAWTARAEARVERAPSPRLTPPMAITVPEQPEERPPIWPTDEQSRIEYYRERRPDEGSCGWACADGTEQREVYIFFPIGVPVAGASCVPTQRVHRVRAGETLTRIARAYGFDDYRAIYNEEINFDLFHERPDPNVIMVDDLIVLPPPPGVRYCFTG